MQRLQTAASSVVYAACCLCSKVAQRDPGDSPFQDLQDWHAVPSQGSRQVGSVSLEGLSGQWPSKGHSGQGPRWPNYNVYPHQAAEKEAYDRSPPWGHVSKKWGFTKFNEDENMGTEEWLTPDGCGVKYIPNIGPLDKWQPLHS